MGSEQRVTAPWAGRAALQTLWWLSTWGVSGSRTPWLCARGQGTVRAVRAAGAVWSPPPAPGGGRAPPIGKQVKRPLPRDQGEDWERVHPAGRDLPGCDRGRWCGPDCPQVVPDQMGSGMLGAHGPCRPPGSAGTPVGKVREEEQEGEWAGRCPPGWGWGQGQGSSILSPPHRQVTAVGPWSALAFPTGMAWGWPGPSRGLESGWEEGWG